MKKIHLVIIVLMTSFMMTAQSNESNDAVIENIVKEANENSQLEQLGHELMDVIGPRLVGTPQMKQANDWAVKKYNSWGITARNEQWGAWRGWERGITHIDMTYPRVQSLKGTQLAWNPSTSRRGCNSRINNLTNGSRFTSICRLVAFSERKISNDFYESTNRKTRL